MKKTRYTRAEMQQFCDSLAEDLHTLNQGAQDKSINTVEAQVRTLGIANECRTFSKSIDKKGFKKVKV